MSNEQKPVKFEKLGAISIGTPWFKILCPQCGGVALDQQPKSEGGNLFCPSCKNVYRLCVEDITPGKTPPPKAQVKAAAPVPPKTFSLVVCMIRAKQDWSNEVRGKPFSSVFGKWKSELEKWYAVVQPANYSFPANKVDNNGDSVVIVISGIDSKEEHVFTKEPMSRLAIERVLNEMKDKCTITRLERVHYDFISTTAGLDFKKP